MIEEMMRELTALNGLRTFFTEVKDYKELGAIIFYQMPESGYENSF